MSTASFYPLKIPAHCTIRSHSKSARPLDDWKKNLNMCAWDKSQLFFVQIDWTSSFSIPLMSLLTAHPQLSLWRRPAPDCLCTERPACCVRHLTAPTRA